jgi:hypothetical protein
MTEPPIQTDFLEMCIGLFSPVEDVAGDEKSTLRYRLF